MGDFHNALAAKIRSSLNETIRPGYFARLIPYVTYESLAIGEVSHTYLDMSLLQPRQSREVMAPPMDRSLLNELRAYHLNRMQGVRGHDPHQVLTLWLRWMLNPGLFGDADRLADDSD